MSRKDDKEFNAYTVIIEQLLEEAYDITVKSPDMRKALDENPIA